MKEVTLICVGKLKEKALVEFENNYIKRINSVKFKVVELKALQEDKDAEALSVLKKVRDIGAEKLVLLTEHGDLKDSVKFSKWLYQLIENNNKIALVISGAAGHGDELLSASDFQISLSPMTLPHQMARVVLVEQIYRAQTIHTQHPYHK